MVAPACRECPPPGRAARRRGQHPSTPVIFAAASGALAAIALHQELMYEDAGLEPALPRAGTTML